MNELRKSLEDTSSLKEKELATAMEKLQAEVRKGLDDEREELERKLQKDQEK